MKTEYTSNKPISKSSDRSLLEREAIIDQLVFLENLNFQARNNLGNLIGCLAEWEPSHPDDFINLLHMQLLASRVYDELEVIEDASEKLIKDIEEADRPRTDGLFKDKIIGYLLANDVQSVAHLFNRL